MATANLQWTEERVALARRRYEAGHTYLEIAQELGAPFTRASVSGLIFRKGWSKGTAAAPRRIKIVKPRLPAPAPRPKVAPEPAPPPVVVGGERQGVVLAELGHGCKWPLAGDGADMTFCGCPRLVSEPYCTQHQRASMRSPAPASERQKAAALYQKSITRLARLAG